jgi:hypothetical protein
MPKVFISYSHKDKSFAQKLYAALSAEGIEVSIDDKDFQIGDSLPDKIGTAIDTSDFVIAILSSSSVKSNWVLTELKLAITKEVEKQKKSILPIKIQECDVPNFLKDKIYADFTDPDDFHELFRRVVYTLTITDNYDLCEYCKNSLSVFFELCPHCGRPAPPPNVRAAKVREERETLEIRYEAAYEDAASRGCEPILRKLDVALAESKTVLVIPAAALDKQLPSSMNRFNDYPFYYQFENTDHLTAHERTMRHFKAEMLFCGYQSNIRYATLSLDGIGLSTFGECSLVLRNEMIAHRTSLFDDVSNLYLKQHNIPLTDRGLPLGYRSTWNDRNKLGVAKLARRLTPNTESHEFPGMLLHQGKAVNEDEFIEAHIGGEITIRTIERVIIQTRKSRQKSIIFRSLSEKLTRMGVKVEMR